MSKILYSLLENQHAKNRFLFAEFSLIVCNHRCLSSKTCISANHHCIDRRPLSSQSISDGDLVSFTQEQSCYLQDRQRNLESNSNHFLIDSSKMGRRNRYTNLLTNSLKQKLSYFWRGTHNHAGLFGAQLLKDNAATKGLAFDEEERIRLRVLGLLPPAHRSQDVQVQAAMNFISNIGDELTKYIYLRNVKDYNERMFYKTLAENVETLMPIVYTPVVGLACQKYSHIYLRPRGLYVTIHDLGRVEQVIANWPESSVHAIVVTDGERILGLGDLGAGGMGISIGKLSLYTALAGVPPHTVLPVCIDVGTNNQSLLDDPFYIGLRQLRERGNKYYQLLDEFMTAVVNRFGQSCLIQFEDFANATAFHLLEKYRGKYCTFNDDIQGTASVCVSGLISAAHHINSEIRDHKFLFFGSGEANLGTARLLVEALIDQGLTRQEATQRIWMMDVDGLIVDCREDCKKNAHKAKFAHDVEWLRDFHQIIDYVSPSVLIGASAASGAFNESVLRKMATLNKNPIIFALSNPTSKAECTAEEAYRYTDGRCVFASGSPFDPVVYNNKTYVVGQGNNAYIFPGIALAVMASQASAIPEKCFLVAAKALSDQVTEADARVGLVYPQISKIREVTLSVAAKVMEYFYEEQLAGYLFEPKDKLSFLRDIQYNYDYDKPKHAVDCVSESTGSTN